MKKTITIVILTIALIASNVFAYLNYTAKTELDMQIKTDKEKTDEMKSSYEKEISELESKINKAREDINHIIIANTIPEYKLFFGEWEVTKVIDKHHFYSPDNAEELIGTRFVYDGDYVKKDGTVIAEKPFYSYYLIPMTGKAFIERMMTPDELGLTGNFFIYVSAYYFNENIDFEVFDGCCFYVKDDETLILDENDTYYEMKRISHKYSNMDPFYEHL